MEQVRYGTFAAVLSSNLENITTQLRSPTCLLSANAFELLAEIILIIKFQYVKICFPVSVRVMTAVADSPLFFHDPLAPDMRELTLSGDEAVHAGRSRRLGPGDGIALTNGRGLLGIGTVEEVTRQPPSMRVSVEHCSLVRAPATEVVLATALPKGDRLNTLLDMATQLGMQVFQPLDCIRSVVRHQQKMTDRFRRVVMSAAKQCRQTRFPRIEEPRSVQQLLAGNGHDAAVIYGEPSGDSLCLAAQGIIRKPPRVVIVVGPEGGFDNGELELLRNCSAMAVNCGSLILRTETAALALLTTADQWLSTLPETA